MGSRARSGPGHDRPDLRPCGTGRSRSLRGGCHTERASRARPAPRGRRWRGRTRGSLPRIAHGTLRTSKSARIPRRPRHRSRCPTCRRSPARGRLLVGSRRERNRRLRHRRSRRRCHQRRPPRSGRPSRRTRPRCRIRGRGGTTACRGRRPQPPRGWGRLRSTAAARRLRKGSPRRRGRLGRRPARCTARRSLVPPRRRTERAGHRVLSHPSHAPRHRAPCRQPAANKRPRPGSSRERRAWPRRPRGTEDSRCACPSAGSARSAAKTLA